MKRMKKLMALVIAVAMVLAMGVVAFAADETYKIAIKNETSGFTYNAYQIFTGDLSKGDNGETVLSNVAWGSGISDTGKAALYNKYSLTGTDQTAQKVANAIAADTSTTKADDIATLLAKTTTGGLGAAIEMPYSENITVGSESFKGYAATGQAAGWYLVVNTAIPTGDSQTYSDYIVQVVQDVAIAPKSGVPESEKHIDATTLVNASDYNIGDDVPFVLTFKLPSDYANYATYPVDFYDDMCAGLTYNGDAKIYYGSSDTGGTDITFAADTSKTSEYTGGTVYKAAIADLKTAAPALRASDVITIKYSAKLNANAVTGSTGNPNKYQVVFSNNPNGDGKGTTPWDKNIVFTYKSVFNKIDKDNKPLTGADFTLFKFVPSENGQDTYGEGDSAIKGTWTNVTELHSGDGAINPTKTKSASGDVADAVFTFNGIDAGIYKLVETTTPTGYNTIDDVIFEVTASFDPTADNPVLTTLAATGGLQVTGDVATGTITSNILNEQGSELPTTGGIGTTIFYIVGAILVVGGGILLVSRRRMSSN